MTMTIEAFITTLFVVCVVLGAGCVFLYFRCVALECEVDVVQESKDALRERMRNTNRDLQQQLERAKGENHALRTQLRMKQQKQDN